MSHAVVVQVTLDPNADAAHRRDILEEFVLPMVRALPGFEHGTWLTSDAGTGTCIVTFDTEAHAKAAVEPLAPEGGPPVLSVALHTVEIEAAAP